MTIYCIDDGGDGTQTNATQTAGTLDWSKADTTIANLLAYDAAALTTSGNIIYFGHDTTQTQASALTVTGPSSGLPVAFISADRTQATPTYLKSATNQLETTGANAIIFDGSFSVFGLRVHSGSYIRLDIDSNESCFLDFLELAPAHAGSVDFIESASYTAQGVAIVKNLTVDLTDDTGETSSSVIKCSYMKVRIDGLQFIDPSNRTGGVIDLSNGNAHVEVTGADFSGFTNGTLCEIITNTDHPGKGSIYNSKTAEIWLPRTAASVPKSGGEVMFSNVGPLDNVTYLSAWDYFGAVNSSSAIYRTGGATIEGDACSWLITTTANCSEGAPFYTPWIYGTVNSTGAKTFDCYITNDTADFTDAEVWLEVEYLATADDAKWTLASDQRATITTTAAAQTDDVTSTWVGSQANMLTYSEQFDNAAWIKTRATVTANATTDPLGGATADKLVEDATATNTHRIEGSFTTEAVAYTVSVYAKAAERGFMYLRILDSGVLTRHAWFNLSTGAVGTVEKNLSASITDVGSGWYRCVVTISAARSGLNDIIIGVCAADNAASYSGDGTSGIYIWGAQRERGSSVSAYSATTTAAMTARYKQKLSVPATIGETGQFRCRVAVGVASIAGSRYFYVDPDCTVT